MTADTYQGVYAYAREYRATRGHMPTPREAFEALGLTRKQYVAALRWLLRYKFLSRVGGEWRNANFTLIACSACGGEITPKSAEYTTVKGHLYRRPVCHCCYQARRTQDMKRWRERNPNYDTRQERRRRRQQRSASA